jgi:hypothetical protein
MNFEKLSSTNAFIALFGLTNDQLHGFFSQLLSSHSFNTGVELRHSSFLQFSPLPFQNYSHWKKWMIFFM